MKIKQNVIGFGNQVRSSDKTTNKISRQLAEKNERCSLGARVQDNSFTMVSNKTNCTNTNTNAKTYNDAKNINEYYKSKEILSSKDEILKNFKTRGSSSKKNLMCRKLSDP